MSGRRLLWALLAVYAVTLGYLTLGPAPTRAIDTGERVVSDVHTRLGRRDPAAEEPHRRRRRRDLVDGVLNVALFVPLGALLLAPFPRLGWRVVLIGAALSIGIELVQPLIDRSRQLADVVDNTSGTAIGWAVAATAIRTFPRTRRAPPPDRHDHRT